MKVTQIFEIDGIDIDDNKGKEVVGEWINEDDKWNCPPRVQEPLDKKIDGATYFDNFQDNMYIGEYSG